jgi:hypothetical protein
VLALLREAMVTGSDTQLRQRATAWIARWGIEEVRRRLAIGDVKGRDVLKISDDLFEGKLPKAKTTPPAPGKAAPGTQLTKDGNGVIQSDPNPKIHEVMLSLDEQIAAMTPDQAVSAYKFGGPTMAADRRGALEKKILDAGLELPKFFQGMPAKAPKLTAEEEARRREALKLGVPDAQK